MTFRVNCPHCGSGFNAEKKHEGKRAKCRKCGEVFVITQLPEKPLEKMRTNKNPDNAKSGNESTHSQLSRSKQTTKKKPLKSKPQNKWLIPITISIVGLIAIYIGGRELVNSRISQKSNAVETTTESQDQENRQPLAAATTDALQTAQKTQKPQENAGDDIEALGLGEVFQGKGYTLALTSTKVSPITIEDPGRPEKTSEVEFFVITFHVKNQDDTQVLKTLPRDRKNPMFKITDNLGHDSLPIPFGNLTKIKGSIAGSEGLNPGEETTHNEVFIRPVPLTKYLLITVNLQFFGDEGEAKFILKAGEFEDW